MKISKNSLHASMINSSRERKSLSGAIKSAKLNTPAHNAFWREVGDMCGVKKSDIDPKFIIENGNEKDLNKFNKAGEKTGKREKFSAWGVQKIVRAYAITNQA